jgi:REP element-mobilizing transposase RayT
MHHRKSPRASRIDYTASAAYFVTICTKDRMNYFGEIYGDDLLGRQEMKLNPLGLYCHNYIQSLSEQRTTVDIHEWVVMPNHVHILLYLSEFTKEMNQEIQDTRRRDVLLERPDIEDDTIIGQAKSLSLPINT